MQNMFLDASCTQWKCFILLGINIRNFYWCQLGVTTCTTVACRPQEYCKSSDTTSFSSIPNNVKIVFVVKFQLSENTISKSGSLPTSVFVNIDYETCSPLIFPTFFFICFQLCYLRCRCRRVCRSRRSVLDFAVTVSVWVWLRLAVPRCRLCLGLAPSCRPSSPSPSEFGAVLPSLVFVTVRVWHRLAVPVSSASVTVSATRTSSTRVVRPSSCVRLTREKHLRVWLARN